MRFGASYGWNEIRTCGRPQSMSRLGWIQVISSSHSKRSNCTYASMDHACTIDDHRFTLDTEPIAMEPVVIGARLDFLARWWLCARSRLLPAPVPAACASSCRRS